MAAGGDRRSYTASALVAIGLAALLGVLLYVVHLAAQFLLMAFAGILLAVVLDGASNQVARHTRLHRSWALALFIVLVVAAGGAFAWLGGSQLATQATQLSERIPQAIEALRGTLSASQFGKQVLAGTPSPQEVVSSYAIGLLGGIFSTAFQTVLGMLLAALFGIFLSADPDVYRSGLVRLFPMGRRARAHEVLGALGSALRRWFAGRLVVMVAVGVLTMAAFIAVGLPSAFLLGLIAGLLAFIPYLGALMAAVPAVLVAFTVSVKMAVYALIVYAGVHVLEGYIVTPLIQERAVKLPPALLLLSQVLFGALFGVLGILLATPLILVLVVVVQMVYVEDVLGDSVALLGQPPESGDG